jgi:hypothetical protein
MNLNIRDKGTRNRSSNPGRPIDENLTGWLQRYIVPGYERKRKHLDLDMNLVGSRNQMIKSLNLEAVNCRVLTVSSLLEKRSVFVNGSLTASTKSSTQIPWKFANLRHLSEKPECIAKSSVLGTGGQFQEQTSRPWHRTGIANNSHRA